MTYTKLHGVLKISGVDRTANLEPGSLVISNILTRQVDTVEFKLTDVTFAVTELSEVEVYDNATRLFYGLITTTKETVKGTNKSLTVSGTDFTFLTEKTVVIGEFSGTDRAIIQALFTAYLPEIETSTFVSAYNTYTRLRYNRHSLREIVDQLATSAGAEWYIDENKKLHFFQSETSTAPFSVSQSPNMSTSFPFERMDVSRNASEVVNRIELVGGNYLSPDTTLYVAGTGKDKNTVIPFRMRPASGENAVKIWRNDGTAGTPSWTLLTVKPAYIDSITGANDVLYYYAEKAIETQDVSPDLPNAFKIFGRKEIPLRTRLSDSASIAFYGRVLDGFISNKDIVDRDTARTIIRGTLAKSALAHPGITFIVRQPGLRAGMALPIYAPMHSINGTYLIHSVKTTFNVNGLATFDIQAGTYDPSLADLVIAIARAAKTKPDWNDAEVLDELIQVATEHGIGSETHAAVVATNKPYRWGPTGNNPIVWDFFVWS